VIAAIIPAAGKGTRMGGPKLTLPIGGRPLIALVVQALRAGGANPVVVVVGPSGRPGSDATAAEATRAGAVVVVAPDDPPDMRASVVLGLDRLSRDGGEPTAWLLCPGDSPGISPEAVDRVIRHGLATPPGSIVVPTREGRRGHPVYFPWEIAREIRELPEGRGVNAVVAARSERVVELDLGGLPVDADLDTPDDYRLWASG
jgi:molybdenum cofactor cytidylyltransferase